MDLLRYYSGKSKTLYLIKDQPHLLLMKFEDTVTAGDGAIRMNAPGKGIVCARTSAFFMNLLERHGIKTHLASYDGSDSMYVKKLKIVPVEVIVRNYAYGSQLKRLPLLKKLQALTPPVVEYHYKDDALHDPLILREDVVHSGLLTNKQLAEIEELALRINDKLKEYLTGLNLKLVDLKLEFGFDEQENVILGDEITGDTIRVLDEQNNHLDKEIFRQTRDVKLLMSRYIELARRVGVDLSGVNSS
ncbi:MAG: phosphoribosylaminoimidazolesuccinocarboxamide synthase [Desulfurococcaceae archaeon]